MPRKAASSVKSKYTTRKDKKLNLIPPDALKIAATVRPDAGSESKFGPLGDLTGKRVTVMGLGLFGGGVGAARYFAGKGAVVTVTDKRAEKDLLPSKAKLDGLDIRYVLGTHEADDFRNADILVVNPGVTPDNPYVVMARGAGVRIEHSMNLLFKLTPKNPKLGVTGSNGKSTTTAMLGEMLRIHDSRTLTGGNIGKCLLSEVDTLAPDAPLVLELSSFMLTALRELQESPGISIVTNLTPNHLDWHGSMAEYARAKLAIIEYQKPDDVAILNADDPSLAGWENRTRGRVLWFSAQHSLQNDGAYLDGDRLVLQSNGNRAVVGLRSEMRLPGMHNVANALAAAAAAAAYGITPGLIAEALSNFGGLPHRLEMVARTDDDVAFYNDSIATTPESAICALNSFERPITLIAGGYDKGTPFDDLGMAIAQRARRLILLGVTAPKIECAVRKAMQISSRGPEIIHVGSLEEAASVAAHGAIKGEAVLLSPACASFDMFRNFEERGFLFKKYAKMLALGN